LPSQLMNYLEQERLSIVSSWIERKGPSTEDIEFSCMQNNPPIAQKMQKSDSLSSILLQTIFRKINEKNAKNLRSHVAIAVFGSYTL
jgi:predicted restriction endonuclease